MDVYLICLSTVLETLEAILDMLEQIKNVEGPADFKTGSECYNHIFSHHVSY